MSFHFTFVPSLSWQVIRFHEKFEREGKLGGRKAIFARTKRQAVDKARRACHLRRRKTKWIQQRGVPVDPTRISLRKRSLFLIFPIFVPGLSW